jgi:hypothetical protein
MFHSSAIRLIIMINKKNVLGKAAEYVRVERAEEVASWHCAEYANAAAPGPAAAHVERRPEAEPLRWCPGSPLRRRRPGTGEPVPSGGAGLGSLRPGVVAGPGGAPAPADGGEPGRESQRLKATERWPALAVQVHYRPLGEVRPDLRILGIPPAPADVLRRSTIPAATAATAAAPAAAPAPAPAANATTTTATGASADTHAPAAAIPANFRTAWEFSWTGCLLGMKLLASLFIVIHGGLPVLSVHSLSYYQSSR